MNATERRDGMWRSLASNPGEYGKHVNNEVLGFIERVRHRRNHYGLLQRAEMAYHLKQIGFDLEIDAKTGFFELSGISQKTIDTFSARSKEIKQYLEKKGFVGGKAAAIANRMTREVKKNIPKAQLLENWSIRESLAGINVVEEIKSVEDRVVTNVGELSNRAAEKEMRNEVGIKESKQTREALDYAIAKLSEYKIHLTELDIANAVLQSQLMGNASLNDISSAINSRVKSGLLIALSSKHGDVYYVSQQMLESEKAIAGAAQNRVSGFSNLKIDAVLGGSDISKASGELVQAALKHDKQITIIDSANKKDRPALIEVITQIARSEKKMPILLTSNKHAASELARQIKKSPESIRTFFSWLLDNTRFDTVAGHIWKMNQLVSGKYYHPSKNFYIVDGAERLSAKQYHELVNIATLHNAKVILFGDSRAKTGFGPNNPYKLLSEHGAKTLNVTEFITERVAGQPPSQKNSTLEKTEGRSSQTLSGIITRFLKNNQNQILSFGNKNNVRDVMVEQYTSFSAEQREMTLLMAPSKVFALELNLAVRQKRQMLGELGSETKNIEVLLPKYFANADYRLSKTYSEGQVIRFNDTYKSLSVKRGDYLTVEAIFKQRNIVLLKRDDGKIIKWEPLRVAGKTTGKIEVFQKVNREIALGDRVSFLRNHNAKKIIKHEPLIITQISGNLVKLKSQTGKVIRLSLNEIASRHFDYHYADTPNTINHKPVNIVIAYQSANFRTNQKSFFEVIRQEATSTFVYTESKQKFIETLSKSVPDQDNILSILLSGGGNKENTPLILKTKCSHASFLEEKIERIITELQTKNNDDARQIETPVDTAKRAVDYALAHLAEREAAFAHTDVLSTALAYALGDVSQRDVTNAVTNAEKNGELLRGIYSNNGTKWTTKEMLAIERASVEMAMADKGSLLPIVSYEEISKKLESIDLSQAHKSVLTDWLTSKDRVVAVQGRAGTGKTTMLSAALPLLESAESIIQTDKAPKGFVLTCLAPTHVAVKELSARGLQAQTLDSFIGQEKTKMMRDLKTSVLVVDESSMVSSRKMHDFLKIATTQNARVLLVGDTAQFQAIEAGKPFEVLADAGVRTLVLKEIHRQKNPKILGAVHDIYNKQYTAAFEKLKNNIVEIGGVEVDGEKFDNEKSRWDKIAKDYATLSPLEQSKTLIIALTNKSRRELNILIRNQHIISKQVEEKGGHAVIFEARDMTETEKSNLKNYEVGEVIYFSAAQKNSGVSKAGYYTIENISTSSGKLLLDNNAGGKIYWQPSHNLKTSARMEVFSRAKREIAMGDMIRWTKTKKDQGLISPEVMRVTAIRDKTVTAINIDTQKTVSFDLNNPNHQHWDYAYAMTAHASQGRSLSRVLVDFPSAHPNLTSERSLLVTVTRAVNNLTIYTANKDSLLKNLQPKTKASAIEMLGGPPETNRAEVVAQSKETKMPNVGNPYSNINIDKRALFEALSEQTEQIVLQLFGQPKSKSAHGFQYSWSALFGGDSSKSKGGSLSIAVSGSKQGMWYSFKIGEGGHISHLIGKYLGVELGSKQFSHEALALLGESKNSFQNRQHKPTVEIQKAKAIDIRDSSNWTLAQKKSVAHARKIAKESVAISGTLAEKYLREERGINLIPLPKNLRYHPSIYSGVNKESRPALIVIAKNSKGSVNAIQAIFLDEDGRKLKGKSEITGVDLLSKQTFGIAKSMPASIGASSKKEGVTFVAEGIETALSVLEAIGEGDVKVTFGKSNFQTLKPEELNQHIVLCLDNDSGNALIAKQTDKTISNLVAAQKEVWTSMPKTTGHDFNDVHKTGGIHAVQAELRDAESVSTINNNSLPPINFSKISSESIDAIVTQSNVSIFSEAMMNIKNVNNSHIISSEKLAKIVSGQGVTLENNSRKNTIAKQEQTITKEIVRDIGER